MIDQVTLFFEPFKWHLIGLSALSFVIYTTVVLIIHPKITTISQATYVHKKYWTFSAFIIGTSLPIILIAPDWIMKLSGFVLFTCAFFPNYKPAKGWGDEWHTYSVILSVAIGIISMFCNGYANIGSAFLLGLTCFYLIVPQRIEISTGGSFFSSDISYKTTKKVAIAEIICFIWLIGYVAISISAS